MKQSTLISLLGPITSIWTPSMTPITWGILQLLNSTNLIITSAVSLSVFRNTMKPEANSVIQLQNSFVISAAAYFVTKFFCNITIAASYFQPPEGNSHPFLYWNCFSESCIFSANICWSWRRLEHVFSVKRFRLPRRLEDVLKASRKTS